MHIRKALEIITVLCLILLSLFGCASAQKEIISTARPVSPTDTPSSEPAAPLPTYTPERKDFAFPTSIDSAKPYLFYLHGRIIEDQGIPAISPEFGEYQYQVILETLESYGFVVISEQRPKDTDGVDYAHRMSQQVATLLNAGVPAKKITIVGASKGAGIAIYVSHFLENKDLNFVIMGICHPDEVEQLIQSQTSLFGNVLSIYDSSDEFAGSCRELFSYSAGPGLSRTDEIVLKVGTGHGILYQPLDEWVIPAVEWANHESP